MAHTATVDMQSPFAMIGGAVVVRQIVDRFYDLIDAEPGYARLRAMHADDLEPVRASLGGFLNAWLGGPRDWFAHHPDVCVMSAHGRLMIDAETADQWIDAMRHAIFESAIDPALATGMIGALATMAQGMTRRPQ